MQLSLDFGASTQGPTEGLADLSRRLLSAFGPFRDDARHEPVDQLVKSMISSRTQDEDSQATYDRLKLRYGDWTRLLDATLDELRPLLGPVTHGDNKAEWLLATLNRIVVLKGELRLDFLAEASVDEAMGWLQKLDGVGGKVSAAVLNFSRLKRPVMVVDTHVLRVATRFGLVAEGCTPEAASERIMALAPDFTAEDFYELHWLMKRLGQLRCTARWAKCGACPLSALCARHDVPARSNIADFYLRTNRGRLAA